MWYSVCMERKSVKMIQTRAYLTKAGHRLLDRRMGEQRYLYNCALEHRRNAWRMRRESVSKYQQSAEFTVVRNEDLTEYGEVDRRLSIGTLDRLHKAYNAMFGRWRRGESKIGFPRFKSESRFRTLEIYSGANKYMELYEDPNPDGRPPKWTGHIQIKVCRACASSVVGFRLDSSPRTSSSRASPTASISRCRSSSTPHRRWTRIRLPRIP